MYVIVSKICIENIILLTTSCCVYHNEIYSRRWTFCDSAERKQTEGIGKEDTFLTNDDRENHLYTAFIL